MADSTGSPPPPTAGPVACDAPALLGALRWDTVVGALLVVLLVISFSTVGGFGNALNISFLIGNTLPVAAIALPMTMLVASGEIDLSVGSTVGLSGAVMGALWNHGMNINAIILICALLGVVCGLINALLVTKLGLPSLAVTIGTMALYRGVAQIVLGSELGDRLPAELPGFRLRPARAARSCRAAVLPWLVLAVLAVVVLHATGFGRSRVRRRRLGRGGLVRRGAGQAGQAVAVRGDRPRLLAHRRVLGAALRQRHLQQRHRPGAVGRRRRCCSAASTSTAAAARWAARSPGCSCSARCRT